MIANNDVVMDYFSDIATPLDTLEQVAKECDWPFERVTDHALTIDVETRWAQCTLKFEWLEATESLRFSIVSDLKAPALMRSRMAELLLDVNSQCWFGHFMLTPKTRAVCFTHTCLMRGLPFASLDYMEALVDSGITEFDRFYPMIDGALSSAVTPANDAANISAALFNTIGEA